MASETLSLFPSPVCSIPPKSCLRQAEETHARRNTPSPTPSYKPYPSGKLRGLALQFTPQSNSSACMQSPETSGRPSLSSPVSAVSEDTNIQESASPSAAAMRPTKRPGVAIRKISIDTTSSDTRSDFSGPTLVRTNSGPSTKPEARSLPVKSIFPEYDPALPLAHQRYYPTENLSRPSLERRANHHHQPLLDLPSPTSPVPAAGLSQLQALWNAANGQNGAFLSERIKLSMYRDEIGADSTATELRFGSREGRTLYSVSVADASSELMIRRQHPARTGIVPVAQIDLPACKRGSNAEATIFPQQAALAAIEAAATSHRANTIAQYDPRASSPQAAQLALDAVAEAKARESCQLVHVPIDTDEFGIERYKYELRHPRVGVFSISVEGTSDLSQKSNGRISIHPPSASEKASSKPVKLVCLDLNAESLDVDVALFRKFQSRYMVDSAICAVLAVAMTESNQARVKTKMETFAAPPQVGPIGVSTLSKTKVRGWRRERNKKAKKEKADAKAKLPRLTRGVLYLLGFSFEAVVWLLGLGVKALSKVIVSVSGMVSNK